MTRFEWTSKRSDWDAICERLRISDPCLPEKDRYYKSNKFKVFQCWMARYIREILLNIEEEDISDAEDWIKEATDTDKRNVMRRFLAKHYALYAVLLKRKVD